MTRPADAMPAGAELDRLVAEKVMGWRWYAVRWTNGPAIRYLDRPKARQNKMGKPAKMIEQEADDSLRYVPKYSAEIASAWDVVERLRALGDPSVYVLADEDAEVFDTWGCLVMNHETGESVGGIGYGDTAALAICRAALKAINGEE